MIWEFRGPGAGMTAQHYEIHLREYLQKENIDFHFIECRNISEFASETWLVVNEDQMAGIRADLKPHRGQVFQE